MMTFMAGRLCPIFMTMSMLISCASIEELPVSMDLSVVSYLWMRDWYDWMPF